MAQTFQERRDQFHALRLGENLDSLNPPVEQARARFLQQTDDPAIAQQLAWPGTGESASTTGIGLSNFDCFWLFAGVTLALTPVVFLMKPARIAGE